MILPASHERSALTPLQGSEKLQLAAFADGEVAQACRDAAAGIRMGNLGWLAFIAKKAR